MLMNHLSINFPLLLVIGVHSLIVYLLNDVKMKENLLVQCFLWDID